MPYTNEPLPRLNSQEEDLVRTLVWVVRNMKGTPVYDTLCEIHRQIKYSPVERSGENEQA